MINPLLILVALIWGITNVHIKNAIQSTLPTELYKSRQYLIATGINLTGSVLYNYLMVNNSLSLVSGFVNSSTMVVTLVYGWYCGERLTDDEIKGGILTLVGLVLIST